VQDNAGRAIVNFMEREARPLVGVVIVHHDIGFAISQRAPVESNLLRVHPVVLPPLPQERSELRIRGRVFGVQVIG